MWGGFRWIYTCQFLAQAEHRIITSLSFDCLTLSLYNKTHRFVSPSFILSPQYTVVFCNSLVPFSSASMKKNGPSGNQSTAIVHCGEVTSQGINQFTDVREGIAVWPTDILRDSKPSRDD